MKRLSILFCLLFVLVGAVNAQSWQYVNNGMTARYTYAIAFNGPYVFLGTIDGVYRSSNHGDVWTKTPSNNFFTHGLEVIDGKIYAMTTGTLFRSINNGTTWEPILDQQVRAIVKTNDILFVAGGFGVLKSINDGATWTTSNGAVYSDGSNGKLTNTYCHALAVLGSDMYVGTFGGENGGIFISRDFGAHWMLWENNGKKYVWDMMATGVSVFASVSNDNGPMGILRCTNRVNWFSKNVGFGATPYIQSFGAYGSTIFAGTMTNTPNGTVNTGPYRSGNNGDTWELFNQGLTSGEISGINCDGTYVYVANWDKGVARFPFTPATTVGSLKLTLYAVDPWGLLGANSRVKLYDRFFQQVDEKWVENASSVVTFTDLAPAGGPYQYEVYNTRSNPWGEVYCGWKGGMVIVAGAPTTDVFKHNTPVMPDAKVYRGNEWLSSAYQMVQTGTFLRADVTVFNPPYAGADPRNTFVTIYLDRDREPPYDITLSSPQQMFAVGASHVLSTYPRPTQNGTYYLSCSASGVFSDTTLLTDAGGWIGPVFTVSGNPTEVNTPTTPETFAVLQNYPNPFNPTTTIEYTVGQSAPVVLKVVDILGQEITLVDQVQAKGGYRQSWTATGSGIYFAVLDVGGARRTIRMLAVK